MAKLEKISGIYTPVWNFNYNWVSKYTAIGVEKVLDVYDNEIRKETNVKKINEGKVENEIYSASTRIPTEVIGVLNDYDLNMIRPFSSEYLLGFSGVDTNIGIHEVYNNIEENLNETNRLIAIRKLKDEFDYYDDLKCVTKVRNVIFNYAYVPLWANHYTYKGKEYHCDINGQTGKTTGSAPKSVAKILGTVFGILCGIGAVVLLITSLI